jgi:transporter family protein
MSWVLLGIFSAVFAALVAIFGKLGLKHVDATLATTIRVIIMTVFFVIVSFSLKKYKLLHTVDSKALVYIFLSGIAGALSWLCYFAALKNGPAAAVSALDRLSIAFILLLGIFFLGESLTIKTALGTLLIVGGAMLFIL